jgi:oxalate decarboxylase/phosphoglucose isomerase-like protein (cupin superfamily)
MTIFAASSDARTFDYQGGDIGYVPAGYGMWAKLTVSPMRLPSFYFDVGHYLENTGNTTLHFLEIFDTGRFQLNMSRL